MIALPLLAGLLGSDPPPGVGVVQLDGADPAAFVSTTTAAGTPLHWANSCVFLRPGSDGVSDLPPDELAAGIEIAKDAWRAATSGCGYLRFVIEPQEMGEVGLDMINRIMFREQAWCRPGDPPRCYDEGATAITTLFFIDQPGHPDDGTILDADIELNAVNFAFSNCTAVGTCPTAGTGIVQDVANTLTHELGHVLGLDHTCWSGSGPQPTDGNGAPVPACAPASSLPPEVLEATMFPFQDPMETKKRTLESDDVAGFCAKYPSASDPNVCMPVAPTGQTDGAGDGEPRPFDSGPCGCRANDTGGMVLGLLVALALGGRRRVRSRR